MDKMERSIGSLFYVKKQTQGTEINVEICDNNVFTVCPECGKEHAVDLTKIFTHGDGSFYATRAYCPKCSAKIRQQFFAEKFPQVV